MTSPAPPVVLVIGLQKSGTSLLLRLLSDTPLFRNPFRFEGKELWGDDPPFAPAGFPAGIPYQREGGERGHELGAADATPEVVEHFRGALAAEARPGKALVLKNPYNTVRVPWLRAALPDARIVAVVRRPLPNVFSLLKKHVENPHTNRGPEEGWWGVKPAGWRGLLGTDKVAQCARQWERVNARLWADRDEVDLLVPYHELCDAPAAHLARIGELTLGRTPPGEPPELETLDDEHERGGALESANRVYRRTGSLELAGAERDEARLGPLTTEQRRMVEEICGALAETMGMAGAAP